MPEALVWARLRANAFRAKFKLGAADRAYLADKGLAVVLAHAEAFVAQRLAPATPVKDGRQTPWRGHPVFLAQHATATCCRSCLATWHGIPKGRTLEAAERARVVALIERWLREQSEAPPAMAGRQGDLWADL